jgi:hypothetical protein
LGWPLGFSELTSALYSSWQLVWKNCSLLTGVILDAGQGDANLPLLSIAASKDLFFHYFLRRMTEEQQRVKIDRNCDPT